MNAFASKGLTEEGLSISLIDITGEIPPFPGGHFRGDASYYTASVVKLFYLAYYEAEKEAGRLEETPELSRAVKDMIAVSSNDATAFVVDSVTGTTSGPEIAKARAWARWKDKRNAVNRFFRARGYRDLNVNQKTFCEDAYGREQAFREGGKNRNRLTTRETARLMAEIARGQVAGPRGTEKMLLLLARDLSEKPDPDTELEIAVLAGEKLPKGTRFWSKAGWAYDVRHLAARVALPEGRDLVLVVFTKGAKDEKGIITAVFEKVAARFAGQTVRAVPGGPPNPLAPAR